MSYWPDTDPGWESKVMERHQSLEWLLNRWQQGKRLVVTRYGDGEVNLMRKKGLHHIEAGKMVKQPLREALAFKDQLACILKAKPRNVRNNDYWFKAMNFLVVTGGHDLYGSAHVFVRGYKHEHSPLLVKVFSRPVLVVTAHPQEMAKVCGEFEHIDHYQIKRNNNMSSFDVHFRALSDRLSGGDYESAVFAGGPFAKILITKLAPEVPCHLLDIGCTLNGIMEKYSVGKKLSKRWTMSWARGLRCDKLSEEFFQRVRENVG